MSALALPVTATTRAIVHGQLDLLLTDGATPVVIDFKTGRPGADVGRYRQQLIAYAVAAAALTGCTDARFFLANPEDLPRCKATAAIPTLRKDFVLHPDHVSRPAGWGSTPSC